ncbi:unnamed protein product [Sphagnum jensenii]|uniref:Uncharacterized protein n=1 Tax=Sphagnum jensenii TaxID=128206 RepID=A0ABP1AXP9_9BRYO
MAAQKAAGHLARGLLSGDEVVTHEVFSYSGDIYLDRQAVSLRLSHYHVVSQFPCGLESEVESQVYLNLLQFMVIRLHKALPIHNTSP